MTRYLLGQLPGEDQVALEQEYFREEATFRQLLTVEDELTYRWLRNELAEDDCRAFERRFLASPEGRERAEFATALVEVARKLQTREAPRRTRGPVWQWAVAAAALLACGISAMLLVQNQTIRSELARLESQRRTSPSPASPVVVSFLLTAGVSRGSDEMRRLQVPGSVDAVRLELVLNRGGFAQYSAALRTGDGRETWSAGALPARDGVVVAQIPAAALAADEYDLTVESPDGVAGVYHFAVVRR